MILNFNGLQVSDVADKEVKKLEKSFKEGSHVRVRVLGFKHLEGLATGVLKVDFPFYFYSNNKNDIINTLHK